jgi:hypothetical protein
MSLPKEYGGLGILDLNRFASALWLRWLWREWVSPEKVWVGTEVPCTDQDRLLFVACTTITLGNSCNTSFWSTGWLRGRQPRDIAPLLFDKTKKKKRTVTEALEDNTWIWDVNYRTGLTTAHLSQFTTPWKLVHDVELRQDQEDRITWTRTPHGEYTTAPASTYKARLHRCPGCRQHLEPPPPSPRNKCNMQ